MKRKVDQQAAIGPVHATMEVVSIDDLYLDAANLRRRDEATEEMLEASLVQFKPFRSIGIDADNVTRAGNGTLKAARAAGVKEVLVVRPEPGQLVAVQRSDLSPSQLTAYAIADNRLSDRATNDEAGLAETLRSLQGEDFDLGAIGFTSDELDGLIKKLGDDLLGADKSDGEAISGQTVDDPMAEWKGMPEFEHQDLTPGQSLKIHFKTGEDVQTFADLVGQVITDKTKFLWFPQQEIIRYGVAE